MVLENGTTETVHTYGWYLRRYVEDVRKAKATPIICSPIPRNNWRDGQLVRSGTDSYAGWARAVAEQSQVHFIDLHHVICDKLDPLGKNFAVGALFREDDRTHTTLLGAQVNAFCVVAGLKALGADFGLVAFLSSNAESVDPTASENVLTVNSPP